MRSNKTFIFPHRVWTAAKGGRVFSPRKALALLPTSGAEAPRGLKSALHAFSHDSICFGMLQMEVLCGTRRTMFGPPSGMIRERVRSIWSLKRRGEIVMFIAYRAEERGECRVLYIERVEDLGQ
jgi:hypothetical protein